MKSNKGITLIALVITIIVMLILVAVTISMAVNGGLFDYAGKAVGETQNALNVEQELSNGRINVGGVWYDSIDDYLNNNPSSPVKISLSIAGEKVTTVPLPSEEFEYLEGTINTGYVIRHKTDGNEFVWVPVDKNQKITLKITSEKDITEVKLYDPYGDEILTLGNDEIEKTYNNTAIEPTINGMYTAKVTTEDGTENKVITVKSLYAVDTYNDWENSEEYAKLEGYSTKQEMYQAWADEEDYESVEEMLQDWGYSSIEEYELDYSWMKNFEDLADYSESVNDNGGFYVARYEAGTTTERTSGNKNTSVADIIVANGIPVSKADVYPYNYVTHPQAQDLAKSMYSSTEYTVDLLTGSAWDRTLGWINENGNKSMKEIAGYSGSWGNYDDVTFNITRGKYVEDSEGSYTEVSEIYTKLADKEVLLTTGATERNSANNIFDLAGNIDEWTNEFEPDAMNLRVVRGGNFGVWGHNSASCRININGSLATTLRYFGFRAALYIQ